MLKVGLTGGIGSGKSTVAKVFEVLGIPVYYADAEAKRLMNENESLKHQVQLEFGTGVYVNDRLDRKALADIVFHDPARLEKLNALVHPATLQDADEWLQRQTTPYAIKEAALIFESGAHLQLDYVIGVHAPAPLRIQRVLQRDHISHEEIMARMDKQLTEDEKMLLCNFIITNDDHQLVIPQVLALHAQLLQLATGEQTERI
jgi:dephospho-CoA kinase